MKELAEAVFKLAEVHDRRLSEIGVALAKLAEACTHYDDRDLSLPFTGIDHLCNQLSGLDSTLNQCVEELAKHAPDESN